MPRWPRACVSTTSQRTTLLLLPPAAAMISESLCGWNLICQVSDGGVSITAFVLLSCRGLQDCESSQSPAVKTRMPDDSSVEIVRWSQIQ